MERHLPTQKPIEPKKLPISLAFEQVLIRNVSSAGLGFIDFCSAVRNSGSRPDLCQETLPPIFYTAHQKLMVL